MVDNVLLILIQQKTVKTYYSIFQMLPLSIILEVSESVNILLTYENRTRPRTIKD